MAQAQLHDDDSPPCARPLDGGGVLLLVKGSTSPHKLAGSIINYLREGQSPVTARAIGAGAVNQAAKGCAIARHIGLETSLIVMCSLEFTSLRINGEERSAISFANGLAASGC